MSYYIKFTYDTGNTFEIQMGETGSLYYQEDNQRLLCTWEDLDLAREALKRMKEHYLWQDSLSTTYSDDLSEPKWWIERPEERMRYSTKYHFNVLLEKDREVFAYSGEYLGFFETLISAEIKRIEEENLDSFNLRGY